eukprot:982165-Rhodomonas_salina.1
MVLGGEEGSSCCETAGCARGKEAEGKGRRSTRMAAKDGSDGASNAGSDDAENASNDADKANNSANNNADNTHNNADKTHNNAKSNTNKTDDDGKSMRMKSRMELMGAAHIIAPAARGAEIAGALQQRVAAEQEVLAAGMAAVYVDAAVYGGSAAVMAAVLLFMGCSGTVYGCSAAVYAGGAAVSGGTASKSCLRGLDGVGLWGAWGRGDFRQIGPDPPIYAGSTAMPESSTASIGSAPLGAYARAMQCPVLKSRFALPVEEHVDAVGGVLLGTSPPIVLCAL